MDGAILLCAALFSITPPPPDTAFTADGRRQIVVSHVYRPCDPVVPRRVISSRGAAEPREIGWVWQETFDVRRAPVLCVCEDADARTRFYPPIVVWLGR
jgi:hypothetical protein